MLTNIQVFTACADSKIPGVRLGQGEVTEVLHNAGTSIIYSNQIEGVT